MRFAARVYGGAVAMVMSSALAACGGGAPASEDVPVEIPVAVQPVRLDTVRDVLSIIGLVVPSIAGDWTVTATEPARIVEITKAEGDAVKTGEVLVRLELPSAVEEITTTDAAVADATARLTAARAELTKLTPLHDRGMISRNMYDTAREAVTTAESQLKQAEGARDAAVKLSDRAIIRARFDGIVITRWHQENDFVAGTPTDGILRVIDPAKVQVAVSIPLARFSRVLPGQPVTVQPPGAEPVPAIVVARQPPTEADAAVAMARLEFVKPQLLPLDTQVQVEIVLDERRDVPVVLSSAIQQDAAGAFVMVAGDDGIAHRRDVRAGVVSGPVTQILAGLSVGEKVITVGLDKIADGTRISTR